MATNIVTELQLKAVDKSEAVSTLLLYVKLCAVKLNLSEVEAWVEHELSGYPDDVPPYREVHGRLFGFNPYRGWIPAEGDAALMDILENVKVGQSLSSLELLMKGDDASPSIEFTGDKRRVLGEIFSQPDTRFRLQINRAHVIDIVERVRTMVLDWALELERRGIIGENFSFSPSEKALAKETTVSINVGTIGSLVGNLGTGNSVGSVTVGAIDAKSVRDFIGEIEPHIASLADKTGDTNKTLDSFNKLKAEAQQEKPSNGKLFDLLADFRNAISGAAGNLIATGALSQIEAILKAVNLHL